jgi:sigma-B regulation protein RsbU (phosphoserine phosphatase)
VGGDYFDFLALPDGRLGLVVADVSGKGTPASLLMASVHAWMQALAGTVDPAELLRRLNRFLYESTQANKFVTLTYAELDPGARRLRYVNAGHIPPYHLARDGRLTRLDVGGPVLGLLPQAEFDAGEVELGAGDVVAVVTDGATEALSPEDEEFGDERLIGVLRRCAGDGAEEVLASLFDSVHAWTGDAGCSDDLTALVVKLDG